MCIFFYSHRQKYIDYESAYTDGSKTGDHVGSAAVFNGEVIFERLYKYFSVFSSEIYTIFLTLNTLDSSSKKKWIIYIDSKSRSEALSTISRKTHVLVLKTDALYL